MKPPVAPQECFRGVFGEIVQGLLAPETEATDIAMMATFLTYASHAMGPLPTVRNGNYVHPLTVWFAIIGKSSLGQKGESHSMSARIWHRAFPDLYDEDSPFFFDGYPQTGAGLVGTLNDAIQEAVDTGAWPAPVGFPAFFLEEEVVDILDRCKRDSKLGVYTRKSWDGRIPKHRSNGKTIIIRRPKVVVLAHGTPGEWRRKVSESDIAGGTVNRFLFCASASDTELPFGGNLDPKQLDIATNRVKKLIMRARRVREITLDQGATKEWVRAYKEINQMLRADDEVSNLIGRAKAYALRLAAIFALTTTPLKGPDGKEFLDVKICADDLKAAMAWIRYSGESIEYAMGDPGENITMPPLAKKILEAVTLYGRHTGVEMQRRVGGRYTRDEIWAAVEATNGQVVIYQNNTSTRGRKGYLYDLAKNVPEDATLINTRDDHDEDQGVTVPGEVITPTAVVRPNKPTPRQGPPPAHQPPRPFDDWPEGEAPGNAQRPPTARLRVVPERATPPPKARPKKATTNVLSYLQDDGGDPYASTGD